MSDVVIDTNVLLVADGRGEQMSEDCLIACVKRLELVRESERVVLDYGWLILGEYQNKLVPNGSPTPGNAFLKWLLQAQQITWVTITPTNAESNKFAEFPPDDGLVNSFDPEDRKFVAVANAHPDKPPILESADSKWLGWENQLKAHGINVEMICRRELEEIHKRKTNHLQ